MFHRLNLDAHWAPLCTIDCLNNYYVDGKSPDFEFVMTNKSQLLSKKHKLFFKKAKHGFTLFCDQDRLVRSAKTFQNDNPKLSFLVKNKNKLLANYTDLSFKDTNSINYLNNLQKSKSDGLLNLHDGKYLLGDKKIKVFNALQQIRIPELDSKSKLKDVKANEIPKEAWLEQKGDMKWVKLRYLKEGCYTLEYKKNKLNFYLLDYLNEPVWGILDIYLNDLSKDFTLIEKDKISFKTYTINLNARSTYWKYFFLSQDKERELKLNEVKVQYNGTSMEFTKPVLVNLMDGKKAFSIESKKPIVFKELEMVTDKLEMKLKNNNKWLTKTYKVPKPETKMIKPDRSQQKIFSTAYIYV